MMTRLLLPLCVAALAVAAEHDTRIADAAQRADRAAVGALLREKADVNSAGGDGSTALHWAAYHADAELARTLLQAGANVNAVTRVGALTPLHLAATNGAGDVVEVLLKAGAQPNTAASDGATPLMMAAAAGDARSIGLLLDRGADANALEAAHGQTALMFAAAKNRAATVAVLLRRGADPAISSKVIKLERPRVDEDGNPLPPPREDGATGAPAGRRFEGVGGQARGASATVMGGMTALLLASREGNLDAARALLEGGAKVNQFSPADRIPPLVLAIANGHYDLAKLLVERGADVNVATIDGYTPLFATIDTEWAQVGWAPNPNSFQERTTYLELMKLLLARGADPNARIAKAIWFRPTSHNQEWVDKKGVTAFWRAAASSDVAAMRLLVGAGADPNLASQEGVTPLMVAAGLGWGANASRNVPDSWAAAVRYCLELGADVNAHDIYNYTALHGAAYRGDNEVVRMLVEKGAKLDVRSKRGQTVTDMANGPLVNAHLPMEHPDTIALLLKLGAPPPEAPVAGAPKTARSREGKD
ncbi:MAG TPA: ankyrin repeat domain-containing protein [Candidatus Acidoferrum sp.]|nr:ankyrin repeat domain-containing protein [Candidatus Acidoferrum sp.]